MNGDLEEKPCYCDSRQCDICTPEQRGDLQEAVRMLAADNARLCGIAIEADKLAEAVGQAIHGINSFTAHKVRRALEAYRITRGGH